MITADTITDEQIRKLMQSSTGLTLTDCKKALQNLSIGYAPRHERNAAKREQRDARARCAEILNARAKESR